MSLATWLLMAILIAAPVRANGRDTRTRDRGRMHKHLANHLANIKEAVNVRIWNHFGSRLIGSEHAAAHAATPGALVVVVPIRSTAAAATGALLFLAADLEVVLLQIHPEHQRVHLYSHFGNLETLIHDLKYDELTFEVRNFVINRENESYV